MRQVIFFIASLVVAASVAASVTVRAIDIARQYEASRQAK